MKHIFLFRYLPAGCFISGILASCIVLCSCTKNKFDKNSFYYFGNAKMELRVISDTIGMLLKDTVLYPGDTSGFYFDKIIQKADSNLTQQGYVSAGNLENDPHIKLVLNKTKKLTKNNFIDKLNEIRNQANKDVVANAGVLVRVKATNKPMLLTDEIVIKFKPATPVVVQNQLFDKYHLRILRKNRFDSLQYTVAVTKKTPWNVIKMSHVLKANAAIALVQLNFISAKKYLSTRPADDFFDEQWTLMNTGGTATEDADIDADLAWDLGMGSQSTILAVIDAGFDTLHTDLKANFSVNASEIPANGSDDDRNGFPDDIYGWNFDGDNGTNLDGYQHGTAVLGLANAVRDDITGIVGSCPGCRSLLIKSGHTTEQDADAFHYAARRGAKVINCSWEQNSFEPLLIEAINRAIGDGITVVIAMTNAPANYCSLTPGISQPAGGMTISPDVIFISRSNSADAYDNGGMGDCMAVLTPSGVEGSPSGLLKVLTTDKRGAAGYNDGSADDCDPALANPDYTNCFWGTSAATPITSGVAGLILSVNPSLAPRQVKNLIQDCADKIENSKADYSEITGKSRNKTHGFGRLNAFEAVRIASPEVASGGKNGVDIFLRDHELDWGNTEKPSSYSFEPGRGTISWWKSMDIKVDALQDETPATVDNNFFKDFTDESPVEGKPNNVFVRVRNRGFRTAASVTVNLYWVHAAAGLPPLPADFWDRFPANFTSVSEWKLIDSKTISDLRYSGASVAGHATDDQAQVVTFSFNAPDHDPSTRNHYCLMAMVTSPDDRMPANDLHADPQGFNMDYVTTRYNNATHRNYNIESSETAITTEFFIYNPLVSDISSKIELSFKGQKIPVIIEDSLEGKIIILKKNGKKRIRMHIDPTGLREPAEIIIHQSVPEKGGFKMIGGLSYLFIPPTKRSNKK